MFTARMRSHAASSAIAARWMTAFTPAQAAVIASRSATEADTVSSPGPAVRDAVSSRRRVRPGRARRGRSMVPIWPAAPVMRIVGTAAKLSGRYRPASAGTWQRPPGGADRRQAGALPADDGLEDRQVLLLLPAAHV